MLLERTESTERKQRPHYNVGLARNKDEIREAHKLRFRVFAEEMEHYCSREPITCTALRTMRRWCCLSAVSRRK